MTQPDRPRGRGQVVTSPPVKQVALASHIPVFQPEKVRDDSSFHFFQEIKPDAVIIIAYGQIIPRRLIEIAPLGWINLHASLLPKYRGAAPINWAIINGESKTGLTTMQIDPGMDTGPTLLSAELIIGADETAPELAHRMSEAGAPLVLESLLKLQAGEIKPTPQNSSDATYAPMLEKELGRIDWALPSAQIYNRIRGLQPWPGAYTTFRGQFCHVWGRTADPSPSADKPAGTIIIGSKDVFVICGQASSLRLESVQLQGKKRISAREFVNGAHILPDERLI